MKQIYSLFSSTLILCGCATQQAVFPDQSLQIEKEVYAMSRNEVISAIRECETNKTRAVMVYAKRRINGVLRDVVVDVNCAPMYW